MKVRNQRLSSVDNNKMRALARIGGHKFFHSRLATTRKHGRSKGKYRHHCLPFNIGVQLSYVCPAHPHSTSLTNILKQHPHSHVSNKPVLHGLQGTNTLNLIKQWYGELPTKVRDIVDNTLFLNILHCAIQSSCDTALFRVLSEHWWDSTHTFHIKDVGELTMTPMDLSIITGVRFGGIPLNEEGGPSVDTATLINLIGYPATYIKESNVSIEWLYDSYKAFNYNYDNGEIHLTRAFLLAVIGATIFSNEDKRVSTNLIHVLKDLTILNDYDWGAAALSFMYRNMDRLCRGLTQNVCGIWIAWEVWANAYLPTLSFKCQKFKSTNLPLLPHFEVSQRESIDEATAIVYYRFRFNNLQINEICFNPWEGFIPLPDYVSVATQVTTKRILLLSPEGGNWYMGERVSAQIPGNQTWLIPKNPPKTMLTHRRIYNMDIRWVLVGRRASTFMVAGSMNKYKDFVKHVLYNPVHSKETGKEKTFAYPKVLLNDNFIPQPPKTLIIPSTEGKPQVITIPMDINIPGLDIPTHVTQVSVETAVSLLKTIAGMQYVLVDQVLCARESLREYEATIQNLTYQINKNVTNEDDEGNLDGTLDIRTNVFSGNTKQTQCSISEVRLPHNVIGYSNIYQTP